MSDFPQGTSSAFARAVSAEIRGIMGTRRWSLRDVATKAGFKSHNYLAIRLRDEKALTLDDVERLCAFLEEDAHTFIERAYKNHFERIYAEAEMERAEAERVEAVHLGRARRSQEVGALLPPSPDELDVDEPVAAFDDPEVPIEAEQEAPDTP